MKVAANIKMQYTGIANPLFYNSTKKNTWPRDFLKRCCGGGEKWEASKRGESVATDES